MSNKKGQYMRVYGERILITEGTIQKTIQSCIDNKLDCIREAAAGSVFVNDLAKYTIQCLDEIDRYKTNDFERGLWFWQKAYYIQSGESVGILG